MKYLENNRNSRTYWRSVFSGTLIVLLTVFVCLGCWKAISQDPSGTDSSTDTDTETETDSITDSDTEASALFTITATLSETIGTVGIVEWSIAGKSVESAYIEFGLDTDYGTVAPVDINESNYRTLLLGMKPSRKYNFRVVAYDGAENFFSFNQILETGPVSNLLPQQNVETFSQSGLAGGYVLSCFYVESRIFIMDADGEYVWWAFPDNHRCSRARMSYDGKHIYVKDVNVNSNEGFLVKINMEGVEEEVIKVDDGHHDFTVLPDGTISFLFFDNMNPQCDNIVERSPDGTYTTIFQLRDHVEPPAANTDGCHSNSLHYHAEDDSYTVSVLNTHQYVKFKRSGELVWIFGGDGNSFNQGSWYRQHGHHILENGNLLFFNNGYSDDDAVILEYSLNESSWQASQVWSYLGGDQSKILGDVQRLPNDNTFITYSSDGIFHEVDSEGNLLRRRSFNLSGGLGYSMWRESLYGAPPKNLTP